MVFVPMFPMCLTRAALCDEGLFELAGRAKSAPLAFRQSIASYVEQFHSTATLARELRSNEEATAFDIAIKAIVRPWAVDDVLEMEIVATVVWDTQQHDQASDRTGVRASR